MRNADQDICLTPETARRISRAVKTIENMPVNSLPTGKSAILNLPVRNGITTSTITARSGTVKGHGTGSLYVDDETGTGNMTILVPNQTFWNVYRSSIPSGTVVVTAIVDGLIQIIGSDC